ncbi:DUF3443 family protein [Bdellovibrio sp. NC01]|uniref:DUF3443 family protein n=1 Tax=Bdellovibrio sp. NC01 TaxID=2220073 RepID=UPI00115BAF28|nr:DUF3443 family protein [Bdellovibrio sp. NC01]QDK37459.1 hypothetical protein DOE51_07610 [Bdellovibrio sp. NC01]
MRIIFLLTSLIFALTACSGGAGGGGTQSNVDALPNGAAVYAPTMNGVNVISVDVSCGYMNMPCVSATVCEPGTTHCIVVDKLLLDTGSSGLRVFASKVSTLNLTSVMNVGATKQLAKVTNFADGTCHWGPVKLADIQMGGETASNIPIQLIQANYATVPSSCAEAESDPVAAQYNGILGVGVRDRDCGTDCVASSNNSLYYACNAATQGSACTGSVAPLASQVRNPVAGLDTLGGIDDSNGSALILPAIPVTGAVSASGYLVFGINTRANNQPSNSSTMFITDSNGYMKTTYNGSSYTAFIDSGSNGLYFPPTSSSLPICSGTVFYCPDETVQTSATMKPYSGSTPSVSVPFNVVNTYAAYYSDNYASNTGGYLRMSGTYVFDWGLPFFFGRTVYTGIYGKSSTVNGTSNATQAFYAF